MGGLIAGSVTFFRPDRGMLKFYSFEAIMIALLVTVCLWKGEKPQWRWGNK
jgi:hypothetical protein